MVLESTIVCVDNSEFSRNGDFPPTRFACQVDSVNMLCSAKVHANAESSVGLLTLAGRSARILVTSTRDLGRVFTSMHDVKHDGNADVLAGIQKAQLALKHRHNPRQRQRIVVFVASPIAAPTEALVRLAKSLKKNSVAVDVVNIGVEGENIEKIDAFVSTVNSNDNSHGLHVDADGANLADALMNSDIYLDRGAIASAAAGSGADGASAAASGAAAASGDFAAIDAADGDAELAMVLRISMEEERARQAAAAAAAAAATATDSAPPGGAGADDDNAAADDGGNAATAATSAVATPATATAVAGDVAAGSAAAGAQSKFDDEDDADLYGTGDQMEVDEEEVDDDEMLRRAIELSKADAEAAAAAASSSNKDNNKDGDSGAGASAGDDKTS